VSVPLLPPRLSDEQLDAIDRRMDERRLLQQWPPLMEWDVASLVAEIRAGRERETALRAENEKLKDAVVKLSRHLERMSDWGVLNDN